MVVQVFAVRELQIVNVQLRVFEEESYSAISSLKSFVHQVSHWL
jgi:hypothetical protein